MTPEWKLGHSEFKILRIIVVIFAVWDLLTGYYLGPVFLTAFYFVVVHTYVLGYRQGRVEENVKKTMQRWE